ncbi:nucleotide exchange factor GrpE [Streptomyces rubellomurinus]|uniref:nucleotide exchange factor GrpE n=1 Tax=Streptomyces rubellomurinus (strain ATCC 31215) TaxID=359131 RepID=UPI000698F0C7|nr:nucleotide exchange factor GrpE [Streptomyces rubellomurinus]
MTDAPPTEALLADHRPLPIPPGVEDADLEQLFGRLLFRASLLGGKLADTERAAQAEQRELLRALIEVDDALADLALDSELVALGRGAGIEATRMRMLGRLRKAEVKAMRLEGLFADPATTEIVGTEVRPGVAPETVVRTVVNGFMWKGEVLRRAQVVVAAGAPDPRVSSEPEPEPEPAPDPEPEAEAAAVPEPDADSVYEEPVDAAPEPAPPAAAAARTRRVQPRVRTRSGRKRKK